MQCASALRDEVPNWLGHDWHGEVKIKRNFIMATQKTQSQLTAQDKNLFRLILAILESTGLLQAFLNALVQFMADKKAKKRKEVTHDEAQD